MSDPRQRVTSQEAAAYRKTWQAAFDRDPINLRRLPTRTLVRKARAIQDNERLPEAIEFVCANQDELSRRPFAAFLICMTLAMKNGEKHRPFVAEFLTPVRALVQPVSEGLFAGALSIPKVPYWQARLMFRLSVLFGIWKEHDHRDWNAIRAWAESLPAKLCA